MSQNNHALLITSESLFAERRSPNITIPTGETNEEVNPYQPIRLTCQANAVPAPVITWFKVMDLGH